MPNRESEYPNRLLLRAKQQGMEKAVYMPSTPDQWVGRPSNPDKGNQYWHQEIKIVNLEEEPVEGDMALLGYACDEGVRRNRGRIGAALGPGSIRERLAKHPIHFDGRKVIDTGDVVCLRHAMESAQEMLADKVCKLLGAGVFPIVLGGGHDMAYGHFNGIQKYANGTPKRIGIINFDAHFDLRPVEENTNSGTPFSQIFHESEGSNIDVSYFAVGIQRQANTKELFQIAESPNIDYAVNFECESSNPEFGVLKSRLDAFIEKQDWVYVTIDMDGFSSAYAPGVSAPSPLGFTPYFVFKMLRAILQSKKVVSCDIAELNPSLDRDSLTANLAAKLVDFIVMEDPESPIK